MIVCVCRRVSHRDIEREADAGCRSFDQLQDELGVATACGACGDCARGVFERACAAQDAACCRRPVAPAAAAQAFASSCA